MTEVINVDILDGSGLAAVAAAKRAQGLADGVGGVVADITTAKDEALADIAAAVDTIPLGLVLPELPTFADIFAKFSDQKYFNAGKAFLLFATFLTSVSGTFTRGGTEHRYYDASGHLVNGTADTPLFGYDPITLAPCLFYGASIQNKFGNSQTGGVGTGWDFGSPTVTFTPNGCLGLDGTMSGTLVLETATTGAQGFTYYNAGATVTAGSFYAFPIYVKPHGRTKMRLTPVGGLGALATTVDFTALTATNGFQVVQFANGIYRLTLRFVATGSGNFNFNISFLDASGASSYTGDPTKGFEFSGFQLSPIAALTAPIPIYVPTPTSAAVTRQADVLTFNLPATSTAVTVTFTDSTKQVFSGLSAGPWTLPTPLNANRLESLISLDLTTANIPVTKVNGLGGPEVNLGKANLPGLLDTDTPIFAGVVTTGKTQNFGGATFRADGALFQWTGSSLSLPSGTRGLILGSTVAQNATVCTNNVLGGQDCFAAAGTLQNMTAFGDTTGGSSPSGVNSVCLGDEFANGPSVANVVGGGVLGRLGHDSTKTATDTVAWGGEVMRYMCPTRSVAHGARSGRGSTSANGTWTNSGFWGTDLALNATGDRTNVWLYGYLLDPPTPTTDNWLNFHDVIKVDLSTGAMTIQKPGGTAATLTVANIAATQVVISGSGAKFNLPPFTVATLPPTPSRGDQARVTNALSPTPGAVVVGGGGADANVSWNGTNWIAF
ncbi:hypothetical protein BH10PSE14_BH10PSE14_04250 [soil metagenome]